TCDATGISGGYLGDGFKTVLPAKASAKVSFRLVGQQNPEKIRESFRAHVRNALPADCEADFISHGAHSAIEMATDHEAFGIARNALTEEWDDPAVFVGCGGSIPITTMFKEILGMDSMLIGFAKDSDQIHSPNEKYDLDSFRKGIRSWARILYALDS
ncbi:MAG: M20/M25/M40 family metallo-hydrolase, partial [Albidovulum sp.]|nr:M20/M25/M40 family metallo-hydrolase [Albidovulum sp.]